MNGAAVLSFRRVRAEGHAGFVFPIHAGQIDQRHAGALRHAGVRHQLVVYPDAPHGFFCDERGTYRPGPAEDAWRRTLDLLTPPA